MHPDRPKVATVDEYMKLFPKETQDKLQKIRKLIKETAPEAVEVISYAIPAYKFPGVKGYPPIYFSGYEKHISIYPLPRNPSKELAKDIEPHIAGKGTLRFYLDQPLPLDLIKRIVDHMANQARSSKA